MSELTTSEVNIMNYLKIFFHRRGMIIVPSILGLVFGICTGLLLPKEYQSTTILLVEEGKTDNPLFDSLAVSTSVEQRMSTIRESMLGWNSLVTLVKRLNMDRNIKTPQELETRILKIRKDITIKIRGRNIISLSYTGKDPELTYNVIKNISEIFIERNLDIQTQETSDAIKFIEEQLKVYLGKIKSAEIAQLKDQLKNLLIDSTEEHPQVRELREAVRVKEEALKKENLEYTENVSLDTATTNPIIQEIRRALDSLDGSAATIQPTAEQMTRGDKNDLYKVVLIDKLDKVVARDVNVNNAIYNMLLQRLETAKITQRLQSSKQGTKYTVLDPPRLPLNPVKPNRLLVAVIGLFCGLAVGVGLVLGMEFLDKSFLDVEEAKNFLGMPLLGAISKIHTGYSLREEKERVIWLYSLVIAAGIVLVVLSSAIANFSR